MQNNNQSFLGFLISRIKEYKISFFFMFILYGFIAIERVYIPSIIGKIIDILSNIPAENKKNVFSYIWKYSLFGILAYAFMDILFRIQEFIYEKIMPKFAASVRMKGYEISINKSYTFFSNEYAGDIGGKINDLAQYLYFIMSSICNVFSPIFLTIIVGIIDIILINNKLGLIYLAWVISYLFIVFITVGFIQKYYAYSANKLNLVKGKVIDGINNVSIIRLLSKQKNEIKYVWGFQNDETKSAFKAGLNTIFVRALLSLLTVFGIYIVFYNTISLWKNDLISLGKVNEISFIFINSIMMVWWFSYEITIFTANLGKARAAFSIFENNEDFHEDSKKPDILISEGKIEFKNVYFQHNNSENKSESFFNDKNIIINARERIGLVGYSGAGKTTFANLILREFDIDNGSILIDEQNIFDYNKKSLHEQITYITQNVSLFHRTIRENLLFAKEDATEEELINACKAANCYNFIMKLENGFDTDIGEQGSKLSGGQKQRISIARGILKNSKIVILDEATSALDSITERRIQSAFDSLSKNKTTIIIAHRLSTLKNVDRIIVFDNGKIIESGSHNELIKNKDSFYFQLYSKQFSSENDIDDEDEKEF